MEDRSLSEIFEVVGGRLRTNFVLALRDGPLRPAQLSQKLDAPISNLYRIFNELKHAGLVESFEKDGLVYWKLTEFGVKWINANIEAITGSLEKGPSKVAYRRRKILLLIPIFILIFSAVRAIASSEPTWFIGGIILSAIAYLIIEKIK